MYKMIAIDLDGTMLNSYGEVTENTKRVIKQTIQNGTEVIIASRKKYRFNKISSKRNWKYKIYDCWKWSSSI